MVADGRVSAAEVAEGIDSYEHDAASVVVIVEVVAADQFDFENGEERFGMRHFRSNCRGGA